MSTLSMVLFAVGWTLMARKVLVENSYSRTGTIIMWVALLITYATL